MCWSLFLIKLQAWRAATLLKRDSNVGAFLWILRNFQEHLFHGIPGDVMPPIAFKLVSNKLKALGLLISKFVEHRPLVNQILSKSKLHQSEVKSKSCLFRLMMPLVYFKLVWTEIARSSHRMCPVRKGVLRNFAKLAGKHLCQRLATLLQRRLWHRCFPVNFAKVLRTPFS